MWLCFVLCSKGTQLCIECILFIFFPILVCHRRLDKVSCTAQQEIVYPSLYIAGLCLLIPSSPDIWNTSKIKDG